MRQAGRYLPEYRAVRAKAGSFLDLCYNPDFAVEVTLQPIRRFGFDAAILFSDILVVPHALGQDLRFEEGRGPLLDALNDDAGMARLAMDQFHNQAAGRSTRPLRASRLPCLPETALIGFAGAPWTVASYMIEGGSSRDYAKTKAWAYQRPESFQRLINLLVEATSSYLIAPDRSRCRSAADCSTAGRAPWITPVCCAGPGAHEGDRRPGADDASGSAGDRRSARPAGPAISISRGRVSCMGSSLDPGVPLDWAFTQLQGRLALAGQSRSAIAGGRR